MQGVEQAVKGGLGMHDTIAQLVNKRTASATSSAPDNDNADLVAQAPEKPGELCVWIWGYPAKPMTCLFM